MLGKISHWEKNKYYDSTKIKNNNKINRDRKYKGSCQEPEVRENSVDRVLAWQDEKVLG